MQSHDNNNNNNNDNNADTMTIEPIKTIYHSQITHTKVYHGLMNHNNTKVPVAVKEISARITSYTTDELKYAVQNQKQEAKVLAALKTLSPQEKGYQYLVMQDYYRYTFSEINLNEMTIYKGELVFNWLEEGDLREWAGKNNLSPPLAKCFSYHMTCAIKFLHDHNYIHADIKQDNLMVKKIKSKYGYKVVLIDLGFTSMLDEDLGRRGTPRYCAPEILGGEMKNTKASDVWSTSATMWEIFGGYMFPDPTIKLNNFHELYTHLMKNDISMPFTMPPSIAKLVTLGLKKQPQQRLTIEKMEKELSILEEIQEEEASLNSLKPPQ